MSCIGRFKIVEADGLPAVTNYDYPENVPIRGINDRTFRWEEVASETPYHLLQSGVYNNTLSPTGYLGLIVEYTGPFTNSFKVASNVYVSGWNISGFMVTPAGATGFNLHSNAQTLYPSAVWEGSNGVGGDGTAYSGWGIGSGINITSLDHEGMYMYEMWTGRPYAQSLPGVLDNVKVAVFQTGIRMITGQRYQFYMEAMGVNLTTNTGLVGINFTPEYGIKPYIIGHGADNREICYYNARSGAWVTSRPTGVIFPLNSGVVSEIMFDFYTVSGLFPGTGVPAWYSFYIEPPYPGVGILIDNIYVDQYQARNPFSEVYIPTGYMLQVTPDLGWHDTLAMFGDREKITNPHLKTLGPYLVSQSTLTDNQDGTVSLTLTSGDFQNTFSNKYNKYLWRALPLSEYLQFGRPGFPRRFFYIGGNLEDKFTIEQIFDDPLSIIKVIIGTRTSRMTVEADSNITVEYPTSTSWKATVLLGTSTLRLGLRGVDKGGAVTKWNYIDLSTKGLSQAEQALWNIFDEQGLLVDLKRLPSESNADFKERIKDVLRSPAGVSYRGIVNGGSRELGLQKVTDALRIKIHTNNQGIQYATKATIEVTTVSIKIRSESMKRIEYKLLDPATLTFETDYVPADEPIIETEDGIKIPDIKIDIDTKENNEPHSKRIKINDPLIGGKVVKVTYDYFLVGEFINYPTLSDLVSFLNNTAVNEVGTRIVSAELDYKLSGGEDSRGLFVSSYSLGQGELAQIGWSPLILRRISDRLFRESFRSSDGTYWNTKFMDLVNELRSNTNIEWGHVIADKDRWDAADNTQESFDHIPTLMDPPLTRYRTTDLTTTGSYTLLEGNEATWRSFTGNTGDFMLNAGLTSSDFHPGVAYINDLRPSIFIGSRAKQTIDDRFEITSDSEPDNKIVFFSGIF